MLLAGLAEVFNQWLRGGVADQPEDRDHGDDRGEYGKTP
jgi:hypothetical protein